MNASTSHFPSIRSRLGAALHERPALEVTLDHETWPGVWREISISLHRQGYQISTLKFYRHVMRSFSRFVEKPPNQITPRDVKNYLWSLVHQPCTWHWVGMNISILRTVFDKLAGLKSLNNQRGPRRKLPLPEYLSRDDITRLISSATTLRDQLILALLYGCGLKVSELQQIRWQDIQLGAGVLLVASRYRSETRRLVLPLAVIPIMKEGIARCSPGDFIFPGGKEHQPLSARAIQLIVHNSAKKASSQNQITPQLLRNSYAVHALESGATIRQVQEALDHQCVETTMRYEACLNRTPATISPADTIKLPGPHSNVQITHDEKLLDATIFPMEYPKESFSMFLKTQLTSRFLSIRQYINTG